MSTRAVADILAMTRDDHREDAAELLAHVPHRYLTTSEGRILAAIAHGILALTAPEEPKP